MTSAPIETPSGRFQQGYHEPRILRGWGWRPYSRRESADGTNTPQQTQLMYAEDWMLIQLSAVTLQLQWFYTLTSCHFCTARGEEGVQRVCVTPTKLFRRIKSTGTAAKPWKRRRWIRSHLLPRFKTLQRKPQMDLVMFHAEHSIFLMSKIVLLVDEFAECVQKLKGDKHKGKMQTQHFLFFFSISVFSDSVLVVRKVGKRGNANSDFVTSFYHISSRKNWLCSWGFSTLCAIKSDQCNDLSL